MLTMNVMRFLHKYDNYYDFEFDASIAFDNSALKIDWPIDLLKAIVSEKD